ncbi:MAG TPA: DPP IV N-terminal domain-containing protein [Terriglobales bacterium]|nr:DPP IV N-terminal domain-containing protein [Terriglobales bacterium]
MAKRVLAVLPAFSLFFYVLLSAHAVAQTSAEQKALTIQNVFAEGGITGRAPEAVQWSPDDTRVSYVLRDDSGDHGELWYIDAGTGERKALVTESKLAQLAPSRDKITDEREKERLTRYHVPEYMWAPDSKHLLLMPEGQLWYYDLASGTAVQFSAAPDPAQDPKFSPDGKLLAYVRKHNLFVHPLSDNGREHALTRDKDENLLNGEVDWVYAEELNVRSNYAWSPDSKEIVFLQMDETRVPTYPITDWMPTHPKVDEEKYPKAGDPNPTVRLGMVGADGGKLKWLSLTQDNDIYIPRFGWIRDGIIWAEVLNRAQDQMDLYFVDAHSGKSRRVLTERSPDAWVNVNDDFRILKSGDQFLWSSWRDGHTHLYLYHFSKQDPLGDEAQLDRQLERGDYEVLQVEGLDEDSGTVFFTCNKGDPRQVQLYAVKLDGSNLARVTRDDGTYAVNFSSNGKRYVETYSNAANPPQVEVCGIAGCKPIWESRGVENYHLAPWKYMEFKAEDGSTLYGQLLMPRDAAPGSKIPLIVSVYGGPAAQLVKNEWAGPTGLYYEILAREGFAIFSVDNRGTPNRGQKFSAAIKGQFGAIELKDQLRSLDDLLGQYPQLDRSRVGVWGWSNGGSMTLYGMTHSDVFKAGVSVAPVTDWHNYDSIYTERIMGLPKSNAKAYTDSSLLKAAGKLHGSLLMVHGTSDDNVHFQNSIQMIQAFIQADQQFRLMLYPNKTHGIAGPSARTHLFQMMEQHWQRELK